MTSPHSTPAQRAARQRVARRIASEARPYGARLALAVALGTVAGLTPLVAPWGFNVLINDVLTAHHPRFDELYLVLAAIWGSLVVGAFTNYASTYTMASCGQQLIASLRTRLYDRIVNLPLAEFDKWRPGDLMSRFGGDMQLMTDAVTVSVPQLLSASVTFVSSFGAMIYIDWLLTLTLLVVAPLMWLAVSRFQKLIASGTHRAQARIGDLLSNLTESLGAQRIVKAFGRERYEVDRFQRRNDELLGAAMKMTQFVQTQPAVLTSIMATGVVVIIWLSVREVLVGRLNVGKIFEYWLLLANLVNPLNRFAAFVGDIEKAIVGAGRVYQIIDLPTERADRAHAVSLHDVRGELAFERVTFRYETSETPVLNEFDARIRAGQIVALVGPSGAGKTTIVNLVPRFYEPTEGRITLDGMDLAEIRLPDLRGAIGIVPQEPLLFRGTIAENIRYGRLSASDAEVRTAAREANAEEFILAFPDGYDTQVGERGGRLSGGQRQRISIARAILRDPRILILDEATSALDSHSEALIEQALDRLLAGRTTLMIAHRLSTVRRADVILYIEAGRVLEVGTHDDLVARGGAYARLHARQFAIEPPV